MIVPVSTAQEGPQDAEAPDGPQDAEAPEGPEAVPEPDVPLTPDEVVLGRGRDGDSRGEGERRESVEQPGKVMRIGTMVRQLLEEVRQAPMDEAGRARLKEIYEQSVRELSSGLSPDLSEELDRIAFPFDEAIPSEAELRVAQAQLVGWLEGLFHGIQATLVAQQMAARAQLDQMRHQELPSGADAPPRSGTYL